MHVCHITSAHPASDPRIFWRECVGLTRRGHSVTLIARAEAARATVHGVDVRGLREHSGRLQRVALGVPQALSIALRQRADIYHIHDPELVVALLVLRLMGKPVVYDAHEWLSRQIEAKDYLHGLRGGLARVVARGIEKLVRRFASAIVTVNDHCREPFLPRASTVVANYADTSLFTPVHASETGEAHSARFVYVGNISAERGIHTLIQAVEIANRATPVILTLAGPIRSASLRQSLEQLAGWKHVDYLGAVPYPDIPALIQPAVAGIATLRATPNHLISSPIKIFEYLACGVPVIASNFPYWHSTLGASGAVTFVDPDDPDEIAAAITAAAAGEGPSDDIRGAARRFAEANFSWNSQLDELDALYTEIVSRGQIT